VNSNLDSTNHSYVIEQAKVIEELTKVIEDLKITTAKTIEALQANIAELNAQVSWFKRQLFGQKSERRTGDSFPLNAEQQRLLGLTDAAASVPEKKTFIKGHERKKSNKVTGADNAAETGLRFGPEVRVEEVAIPNPATKDLEPKDYEVLSYRTTERLCQEKSAYFIKRFVQPVIKLKGSEQPINPPVIESVIASPYADISVLIGLIVDKFLYYQPLYRQHQKMKAQGIELSRATLTSWVYSFIDLFEPVYTAQVTSVLQSMVLSMDETPHKAGRRNGHQQMSVCYLWFLYGDKKEVVIHNSPSRAAEVIRAMLAREFKGTTLLSDGYAAYKAVTAELNLIHACCMAHARRKFIEAEKQEPKSCKEVVAIIRELYDMEAAAPLDREKRLEYRIEHEKPIVDRLFEWLKKEKTRVEGLPKTRYSKALNYALERESSLRVFLSNPDVPIDNNHTERAIRYQVMARKNYLFCWSELGAEKVATIMSLLITCQLHDIDPWEYFTDVATRISTHPQSKVADLIPRNWKLLFGKKTLETESSDSDAIAA